MIGPFAHGWKVLAVVAVLTGCWVWGFNHGSNKVEGEWSQKWDQAVSDEVEAQTRVTNQRLAAYEQNLQGTQNELDKVQSDLAASEQRSGSVRDAADAKVAGVSASLSACTTAASKAAAENARVLADVLKLADNAAGKMAAIADQAIVRGQSCERQYDSIKRPN